MKKKEHQPLHHRFVEFVSQMSYGQLFAVWSLLTLFFASSYFLLATIGNVSHHGPEALTLTPNLLYRLLDSLYYSIITATSTGYGDITPRGFSKALAAAQSICSLFVFAVFVTKLVSHRQELALREVHRLTFEDVFHNIREGLFIVRKDFDGLIEKANHHKQLDEEDWETLVIAYKQIQSLIHEIPDFYDPENNLYTLDARREQLLHEAVHRTLHRINALLDAFSKSDINWIAHDASMNELRELLHIINEVTPLWREKSPYERHEAFEDILHLKDSVSTRIDQALPIKD